MAASLLWKEKVAHSIAVLLVFIFSIHTVYSQSAKQDTFTFSYKSVSLKKVVENLAKASGLHIIYSPDRINMTIPVSLVVKNKTIEEVLVMLEKQTNLSFKILDHHIVIKLAGPKTTPPIASLAKVSGQTKTTQATFASIPSDSLLITSVEKSRQHSADREQSSLSIDNYIKNHVTEIQVVFDTAMLKKLPTQYFRKLNLNNRHTGWFISAGALINDYSAGVELQAGLRQMYAVFNPSWTRNGTYHGGYGLGTSIPLSWNFSVNPVYSYSQVSQTGTFTNELGSPAQVDYEFKAFTRHYQFKLMVQYALFKNIRIQLGPAFNQSITRYYFTETIVLGALPVSRVPSTSGALIVYNAAQIRQPPGLIRSVSPNTQSFKSWLGWEASFSYKINFLRRP